MAKRKLYEFLAVGSFFLQNMLDTFWSTKKDGETPRECSKYFYPEADRKRRSNGPVLDLLNDEDTFAYECDLKYEDHQDAVEAGEESGECTDCCARVSTVNKPKKFCLLLPTTHHSRPNAQF